MKTNRWLAALALLSCASMRLNAQMSFEEWQVRHGFHLTTQSRQLMLVHGIFSSDATWTTFEHRVYVTDSTWHLFSPSLYQHSSFVNNRQNLLNYMSDQGIQNDVVVVAHSMGGLISRLASKVHPMQGILTVATPHKGGPLAENLVDPFSPFNAFHGICYLLALRADRWFPDENYDWVGGNLGWQDVQNAKERMRYTFNDFFLLAGAGYLMSTVLGSTEAMQDLDPTSPAMAELRSANEEQAPIRIAITPELAPDDYITGPFIIPFENAMAHRLGDAIQQHGAETFWSGLILWGNADLNNEHYWDIVSVGNGLIDLGIIEVGYWFFWNEAVIGGRPNDGIVPVWSMTGPGYTSISPDLYAKHTDETSHLADFIMFKVNAFFSH